MNRLAVRSMEPVLRGTMESFQEEPSLELAEQAMAGQLKLLEGMLKSDPSNKSLLLLASQGFGSYAYGFVEDKDAVAASLFYARGRRYGQQGLSSQDLTQKDVPLLFWTTYNWAAWVRLNLNRPEALADLPKIEANLSRLLELEESYYHGSAHLILGALYASRSKFLGGDPQKAKAHFDQQISRFGDFLIGRVLYARYYAVQVQDQGLFEKLLKEVLDFKTPTDSSLTLSNNIAKVKAKRLLASKEDYF